MFWTHAINKKPFGVHDLSHVVEQRLDFGFDRFQASPYTLRPVFERLDKRGKHPMPSVHSFDHPQVDTKVDMTGVFTRQNRSLRLILALFASIAIVFGFMGTALAEVTSYRGLIVRPSPESEPLLKISESQQPLKMVAGAPGLTINLNKLRDGDLIVASGTLLLEHVAIKVMSIEMVGLRELFGLWRTNSWEIFEFEDFQRLNLYLPSSEGGSMKITKAQALAYVLAPENGDRYSIFISGQSSVIAGTLVVRDRELSLSIIDPESGVASKNISLSPLILK
jgi:hypothetical protein